MRRWFILLGITLLVSACSALAGDSGNADTAQTTTNTNDETALVRWDRDPLAIVFRADVFGGEGAGAFYEFNRVPLCTIYGDGRLVWLSPDDEVLFDFLTDQQIIDFVTYLTLDERFYTFEGGFDTLLPSVEVPVTDILTLNVNEIEYSTDSFGNWTEGYFDRVTEACMMLSAEPRRFRPSEGWLRVEPSEFRENIAALPWEVEATGLSLLDVLESELGMVWLENNLVLPIWTAVRDNNGQVLFSEDGDDYLIVFHVPGVTLDSPPPPVGDEGTLATEEPEPEDEG